MTIIKSIKTLKNKPDSWDITVTWKDGSESQVTRKSCSKAELERYLNKIELSIFPIINTPLAVESLVKYTFAGVYEKVCPDCGKVIDSNSECDCVKIPIEKVTI